MTVLAHDTPPSGAPIRVAFVGAGYMSREHLRAFRDVPGVTLAGIHSRTRARAVALAGEFGVSTICDSVQELYERTRADLVVVSVPELATNEVARACFAFPWTMLMEKPVGYDLADAEDIFRAAGGAHTRTYVALNRRTYSSTRQARADLESSDEPRFIHVADQEDQVAALAAGQPRAVVDNWMFANSVHVVDYLRMFGRGRVVRVAPVIRWNPQAPGVVVAQVEFDSGDRGLYEGIWDGPGPWAVQVSTPSKRWEMRPLEHAAYQLRGQRQLTSIEPHPWDSLFKPGLRLQAALASEAARGQPAGGLVPLADALETMRLVAALFA